VAHKNRTCGIYTITSPSNKMYIGQSTNIEKRLQTHKSMLRCGRHPNGRLQGACSKYGIDALQFSLAEACTEERLDAREQWWIDNHNSQYNMSRSAYNPMKDPKVLAKAVETARRNGNHKQTGLRTKALWGNKEWADKRLSELAVHRANPEVHAAIKKARNTAESKEKSSAHAKSLWASESHRLAISGALQARWEDPSARLNFSLSIAKTNTNKRSARLAKHGLIDASDLELRAIRSLLRRKNDTTSDLYKTVIVVLNSNRRNIYANKEYYQ
jgi:group I intron endonuclease